MLVVVCQLLNIICVHKKRRADDFVAELKGRMFVFFILFGHDDQQKCFWMPHNDILIADTIFFPFKS